jgi:hypothetical protein
MLKKSMKVSSATRRRSLNGGQLLQHAREMRGRVKHRQHDLFQALCPVRRRSAIRSAISSVIVKRRSLPALAIVCRINAFAINSTFRSLVRGPGRKQNSSWRSSSSHGGRIKTLTRRGPSVTRCAPVLATLRSSLRSQSPGPTAPCSTRPSTPFGATRRSAMTICICGNPVPADRTISCSQPCYAHWVNVRRLDRRRRRRASHRRRGARPPRAA